MEKDSWNMIKEFYKEAFGFSESLVELVSVMDILKMCVSGNSTNSISEFFHLDIRYIEQVLMEWLNFEGWKEDLEFNPYKLYLYPISKGFYSSLESMFEQLVEMNIYTTADFIKDLYGICQQFYKYEDMIKNEWY